MIFNLEKRINDPVFLSLLRPETQVIFGIARICKMTSHHLINNYYNNYSKFANELAKILGIQYSKSDIISAIGYSNGGVSLLCQRTKYCRIICSILDKLFDRTGKRKIAGDAFEPDYSSNDYHLFKLSFSINKSFYNQLRERAIIKMIDFIKDRTNPDVFLSSLPIYATALESNSVVVASIINYSIKYEYVLKDVGEINSEIEFGCKLTLNDYNDYIYSRGYGLNSDTVNSDWDEFYRVNINYFKNDIKEGIKKYNKLTRRNCV